MNKKSIVILLFTFCTSPLYVHAATNADLLSYEPTSSELLALSIEWVIILLVPLLFLLAIITMVRNFFKKDIRDKKSVSTSENSSVPIKLIAPLVIFLGAFVFAKNKKGYAACDCFSNSYGRMTVGTLAVVFFTGALVCEYFMSKNGKKWKRLHTILVILLFVAVYYITILVGEILFGTFN